MHTWANMLYETRRNLKPTSKSQSQIFRKENRNVIHIYDIAYLYTSQYLTARIYSTNESRLLPAYMRAIDIHSSTEI